MIVKVSPESDIPSPVWPEVRIANTGDHVTRIQLDTAEQAQTRHDSIVTHSLLMMMGDSLDSASSSSCVIQSNAVTVNASDQVRYSDLRNKHNVTKAIKGVRRSFRNVKGSLRNSSRKIVRRGKVRPGNQSGSLRSGGSVEAVRELWSKTGMRTNGRKLLLEASSSEAEAGASHERVNPGYESDNSEVWAPRWGAVITPGPGARTRRQESTSSSGSAGSVTRGKNHKAQKYNKRSRRPDTNSVTFDAIQVDTVDNVPKEPTKVRFNNYHKYNTERRGIMQEKNMLWDRYYGTANPGLIDGGANTMASNFTLDLEKNKYLRKQEKRRKNLRCCCKISCFLILLISFLLVIITVTFFLTKGKKYFGAL